MFLHNPSPTFAVSLPCAWQLSGEGGLGTRFHVKHIVHQRLVRCERKFLSDLPLSMSLLEDIIENLFMKGRYNMVA